MAIMIPSVISPEVKSNAERKIFEWFQNAPGTDKWIVLHSLGIATHNKVIYGETDFLVLAPKLGIFALEVKGGRVRRENGIWYFTNRYGKTNSKVRGPFDQARDGIFSIVDAMKNVSTLSIVILKMCCSVTALCFRILNLLLLELKKNNGRCLTHVTVSM